MLKQYRTEYTGEFVITKTVFRNGKKEQEREWVENPIDVTSHSQRACCIAPGAIGGHVSLERIEKHNGGCLARQRMQLYAAGEVWKHMIADFSVVLEQEQLDEIIESGYQVDNIVYTSVRLCLNNQGEFYLIPYGVAMPPIATIVWIACFDGHKDIYLHGYDHDVPEKVINQIADIMKTYSDVTFHHVSNSGSPDAWRNRRNCETMSTFNFVSYCDI